MLIKLSIRPAVLNKVRSGKGNVAQRSGVRFMLWARDFSRLHNVHTDYDAHPVVADVLSPDGKLAAV